MHSDKKLDTPDAGPSGPARPKSASRRHLLRAGLGAAPAVLTVASMPVRATNCYSVSAFASSNAVATAGTSANARQVMQQCGGAGPSWWVSNCSATSGCMWPSDCKTGGSNQYFPACIGISSSSYCTSSNATATIMYALQDNRNTTQSNMAKYLAAAYLNVRSGKVPSAILTQAQLATIWQTAYNNTYSPVAGVSNWGFTDVYNWMIANSIVTAT